MDGSQWWSLLKQSRPTYCPSSTNPFGGVGVKRRSLITDSPLCLLRRPFQVRSRRPLSIKPAPPLRELAGSGLGIPQRLILRRQRTKR